MIEANKKEKKKLSPAKRVGLGVTAIVLAVAGAFYMTGDAPTTSTYNKAPFIGTTGAYAVWEDDKSAYLNGYSYHVSGWNPEYADDGSKIVFSGIQSKMYSTLCSGGWGTCEITPEREQVVLDYVRQQVDLHANNTDIIGWYLTDDAWGDFTPILPKIWNIIGNNDPLKRPSLCALQLDLKSSADPYPMVKFKKHGAKNFSPSWCKMVSIYSYAPEGATDIVWSMDPVLGNALDYLRTEKGMTNNTTLLGTPQAFGLGNFVLPNRTNVRVQTTNFCRQGAVGILAYAWNDRYIPDRASVGNVTPELYSESYNLRYGVKDGLSNCGF